MVLQENAAQRKSDTVDRRAFLGAATVIPRPAMHQVDRKDFAAVRGAA
jgi:hypothetical protein